MRPTVEVLRLALAALELEPNTPRVVWNRAESILRSTARHELREALEALKPLEAVERRYAATKGGSACACGAQAANRAHSIDPWCPALGPEPHPGLRSVGVVVG